MERGYSSPADGMACRRGIVAETGGFEPPYKCFKGTCLTTWLCLCIAALPGGGGFICSAQNGVAHTEKTA